VVASIVVLAAAIGAGHRYADLVAEQDLRQAAAGQAAGCAERGALFIPRVDGPLPAADPFAEVWEKAATTQVRLNRQTDTMPMLEEATVDVANLHVVTDGHVIAWKVTWRDPSADTAVDAGRFSDAVALQFPITANAAHTMGEHDQRVQILHWKALWQKDLDEHFQDVQDLHPNYWADLYWFAEGEAPYRVPEDFSDPRSHQWFVAFKAGNPLADFQRMRPCEELGAEGFGTLTPHPHSVAMAGGAWRDGEWSVVFSRPLRTADPLDYQFWRGGGGRIGIAVWDGAAGNVGGRKHWANWLDFEVSF